MMKLSGCTQGAAALALVLSLSACGGGTSNPLANPATVGNPANTGGQKLSFVYYQQCINPIVLAQLPALQGGGLTNSCAGAGCHDTVSGTGGALRVVPGAQAIDLGDVGNTPAVIRLSDMYKNYYSAQGEVVVGAPTQSRLLAKPLLLVLHGGGQIFASATDTNAARIAYWINHPMPKGQDEFSTAAATMFTPQDPLTGSCNTQ
jgi:hypothetical protein